MGEDFDPKPEEKAEDPFGKYFEGNNWELPTDLAVVGRADDEIQKRLSELRDEDGNQYWEEDQIVNVAIGLREALVNAIVHGNMGIDEIDAGKRSEEIERRKAEYADKKVKVSIAYSPDTLRIIITDEGKGFDVHQVSDPTDDDHIQNTTGRGVWVMKSFFDSVIHNQKGNEVILSITDEGIIGKNDDHWPDRLPKRLKREDVELFDGSDGQWHWHLRPHMIKDPIRRQAYIKERNQWP
jgi:anti-sigma regulatory factor (Ser/Thr protein kinase)